MSFNWLDQEYSPCESYSRKLDRRVAADEYPYGYEAMEPAAGHVNQGIIDDHYAKGPEMSQKLPWDYHTTCETHPVPRSAKEMGSFPDSESKLRYPIKSRKI
jgi:hypothetical protein